MDLFAILHLPKDASVQDVKTSFRKLALVHHPDRQAGASAQEQAQAATRFAQIKEAYEVLSDDSKRASYQRYGRSGGASTSGRYRSQSTASAGYDPFARADWSYSTARPRARGSVYQALGRMAAGMTRADGLFHLALAGILVFGGLFADQIGSAMWDSLNRGRGFDRIEELAAQKKQAALDAIDKQSMAGLPNPPDQGRSARIPPSFASAPETTSTPLPQMPSPSATTAHGIGRHSASPQMPAAAAVQLQTSSQLSTGSTAAQSPSNHQQSSQPASQLQLPASVSSAPSAGATDRLKAAANS